MTRMPQPNDTYWIHDYGPAIVQAVNAQTIAFRGKADDTPEPLTIPHHVVHAAIDGGRMELVDE